jgi:hypothetical protein
MIMSAAYAVTIITLYSLRSCITSMTAPAQPHYAMDDATATHVGLAS